MTRINPTRRSRLTGAALTAPGRTQHTIFSHRTLPAQHSPHRRPHTSAPGNRPPPETRPRACFLWFGIWPVTVARCPIGRPVYGGQRNGGAQDRTAGAFPVGARAPLRTGYRAGIGGAGMRYFDRSTNGGRTWGFHGHAHGITVATTPSFQGGKSEFGWASGSLRSLTARQLTRPSSIRWLVLHRRHRGGVQARKQPGEPDGQDAG
jgi:hypothetical protein